MRFNLSSSHGNLPIALLAYSGATLVHFAHNAEFAVDYPNLPASLTAGKIYAVWLGITAIGVLGGFLVWKGVSRAGFAVLVAYAALGYDGLLHYSLAPMTAHSPMMNFTIWGEAVMATILLAVIAQQWKRS
jgi:hypothetical protein